jgi:hypothetical protein
MSHKFINNYINNYEKKKNFNRPLIYFEPPPFIESSITYQDVNKDPNLRKLLTDFFYEKTIKWVSSYNNFKNVKKSLTMLKSDKGYSIIYNLLRKYIKKNNLNWYDLKKYYNNIKEYLKFELENI